MITHSKFQYYLLFFFASIALCCVFSNTFAQTYRYVDAYVSYASPTNGTVITSPQQLDITLRVINKGDDNVLPTDTFVYGLSHYFLPNFKFKRIRIPIHDTLHPGDTLLIHHSFNLDISYDIDEFQISFMGGVVGFYSAHDNTEYPLLGELETDQWDNYPYLVLVHRRATSSVSDAYASEGGFSIYPNPLSTQQLHIDGPVHRIQAIQIVSMRGQTVYEQRSSIANSIQLPTLATGLYIVSIQTMDRHISLPLQIMLE